MHSELPDTVNIGKMPIYNTFYIFSWNNFMPNGFSYTPLGDAIRSSFVMSYFNLLTVSQLTIALFHYNDHYYIFDSHSRSQKTLQALQSFC